MSGQEEKVLSKEESFLMQFAAVPLVALPLPVPTTSEGETSADKTEGQGTSEMWIPKDQTLSIMGGARHAL